MAITIVSKNEQADGSFNKGAILEKKPIGFLQDRGITKPFSNLFYWAHAWSENGGLIAEHTHQGFEIMTFVLNGIIEHYDSKTKEWRTLEKGYCQLIKAGSGITHAEKMHPGAEIFQIWFDPDLSKSLYKSPVYLDFNAGQMPSMIEQGKQSRIYVGDDSPVQLDTKGIFICDCLFTYKIHHLKNEEDKLITGFLREGEMEINGKTIQKGDFFMVSDEDIIAKPKNESRVFVIKLLKDPGYKSYVQHG
jgi:quercetin 2,3-dioxygenase